MVETDANSRETPPSRIQRTILFFCVAVIGFSWAFIRPVTHTATGPSVFSPPSWLDRVWNVMTHPVMILLQLAYVCVLFAKEQRIWWRILLAGLVGSFSGQLIHKILLAR